MKKHYCAALALLASACTGTRPTNIGVVDGHLTSCPGSPNCVATQDLDSARKIEPLPIKGTPEASMDRIRELLKDWPRAHVVTDQGQYLHVEFTSRLMRFVDDVEFFAPRTGAGIELRSASRLGQYDFGANRQRIEDIREKYLQ